MEPGYYSTQQQQQDPRADFSEQTSRPEDFPSSSSDLAATVGVGDERFDELPDERLDALHCIPLDLPASPQPVCVNPDQT